MTHDRRANDRRERFERLPRQFNPDVEPSPSARSVVNVWNGEREGIYPAFDEPAASMRPSAINRQLASAWAAISLKADEQANALAITGFRMGHDAMRQMRTVASQMAQRSQAASAWADDLERAENESTDPTTEGTTNGKEEG